MSAKHQMRAVEGPPDGDACRELVQRILTSRPFGKSARMRDFLDYVSDCALDGRSDEIHEQEIGCAVFGRSANYDTGQDNIVRVTASQVRRKLELYFASEGAAEPLILEIPPGGYVPLFRERIHAPDSLPAPVQPPTAPTRAIWLLGGLSALLLIVCLLLAIEYRQQRSLTTPDFQKDPALDALWSQLLANDAPTDIVVADASFDLVEDFTGQSTSLNDYLHPDLWRQAEVLASHPEAQAAARLAAGRHYTSVADVNLTRRIVAMAGRYQSRITVYFARDLSTRQMKSDNVILLGSRRANPWVDLVENQMNFRFGRDAVQRQSFFANLSPRPGESAVYRNDPQMSYCDIAFLPNLSKTGNILVVSGTEMVGTDVGGELLTDPRSIPTLSRVVPIGPDGRYPHFEVFVKAMKVGGSSPGFEVVAHRLLRP